ncbi:hypothetical protein GUITHDRAFT_147302 [Guillardia theta CCMP2712]|uniref:Uncharacterized protein n=1 Tax=Guillardia theta (strain CCMP2712) TaxID=905079 RepID=L1IE21_GUITC|nr:hypothetical protein GUITHDRAFT_147302 [Guillardia theta CCMP2712]EKX34327.1 hypothetical protein GUITHDRAFT_147302 [Guillardia theta CCMP2712]|eukprot:XP_005821307.1 hypothetical protein GUITHDRAFT_147302 [Guillardia theta CCMP2712]
MAHARASAFSLDLKGWLKFGQKAGNDVEEEQRLRPETWSDNFIGSLMRSMPSASVGGGQAKDKNPTTNVVQHAAPMTSKQISRDNMSCLDLSYGKLASTAFDANDFPYLKSLRMGNNNLKEILPNTLRSTSTD